MQVLQTLKTNNRSPCGKRKQEENSQESTKKLRGWERRNSRLLRAEDVLYEDCGLTRQKTYSVDGQIRDTMMYKLGCTQMGDLKKGTDIFTHWKNLKQKAPTNQSSDPKNGDSGTTNQTTGSLRDKSTRDLVQLIFCNQTLINQMKQMYLDIRVRSLKKMDMHLILKGLDVLEAIEKGIDEQNYIEVKSLSVDFYKIIRHDYGWLPPPVISNHALVSQKKKVLMLLSDILVADMVKSACQEPSKSSNELLEEFYKKLDCKLELLDNSSEELKYISRYTTSLGNQESNKYKLAGAWKVESKADERFASNSAIANRKLLWTATNVASIAATLRDGHRIPTFNGDLGKGLHFHTNFLQSLNEANLDYSKGKRGSNEVYLFLSEVALGHMKSLTNIDPSITSPPLYHDSVVGEGVYEPRAKENVRFYLEGRWVTVPVGRPVYRKKISESKFKHSKHAIYDPSQAKLRYLLKFKVY